MSEQVLKSPPPFTPDETQSVIDELIKYGRQWKASDLNIGAPLGGEPCKVTMEIYGRVWDIPGARIETLDVQNWLRAHLSRYEAERIEGAVGVADGAVRNDMVGNVRIHAYRMQREPRLALRLLDSEIPTFEKLGLPAVVDRFLSFQSGIVLVTGKTGAGKTSTLAAVINRINKEQNHHIYTLEDPIEYLHPFYPNSMISQTEVGTDVITYAEGLRGILRAAPHVMMFGELRDAESVSAALSASASGHLVFSTLHTSEASETVQRLINFFPPEQHTNVCFQLAQALRATISQRLVPRADGRGRALACEVFLNMDKATQAMLEEPGKIKQLRNQIQSQRAHGAQLLEAHLEELVARGVIRIEEARLATNYPSEVREPGQ